MRPRFRKGSTSAPSSAAVGARNRRPAGRTTAMPPTRIPGATTAPEVDGYLAVPPVGEGRGPGVVVAHEVFGLNDDTRQQAARLAAAGFLAGAPTLFTAGGALRCLRTTFRSLLKAE